MLDHLRHDSVLQWCLLLVGNVPLYLLVGKLAFRSWRGFLASLGAWAKPDLLSAVEGRYFEDCAAEIRLGLFAAICGGTLWAEHTLFFG